MFPQIFFWATPRLCSDMSVAQPRNVRSADTPRCARSRSPICSFEERCHHIVRGWYQSLQWRLRFVSCHTTHCTARQINRDLVVHLHGGTDIGRQLSQSPLRQAASIEPNDTADEVEPERCKKVCVAQFERGRVHETPIELQLPSKVNQVAKSVAGQYFQRRSRITRIDQAAVRYVSNSVMRLIGTSQSGDS